MVTTTFSGVQAKVAVKTDNTVAYTDEDQVEEISINHDQPLTEIYMLGDPDPQELKEGTIAISGTLIRKYETGNFSAAGATLFAMATTTPRVAYFIGLFPEGDALPKILISNVKFHNYRTGAAVGDEAMRETVDWRGLAIALSE